MLESKRERCDRENDIVVKIEKKSNKDIYRVCRPVGYIYQNK